MLLQIHEPSGYFIGQVRKRGAKTWETVTGRCRSGEAALAKALLAMRPSDSRARALFVDRDDWYASRVFMEAAK